MRTIVLTLRIWFLTGIAFGAGWLLYSITEPYIPWWTFFLAIPVALIGSIPSIFGVIISLTIIRKREESVQLKKIFFFMACVFCCAAYGILSAITIGETQFGNALITGFISTTFLSACSLAAILFSSKQLYSFFTLNHHLSKQFKQMETNTFENSKPQPSTSGSNRIVIKAAITGVLILVMLIPTIFISNLVKERTIGNPK